MTTIAEILRQAPLLAEVSDSPRLDVELFLCDVLGKDRTWLFTWSDKSLSPEQLAQFESLFERRKTGEPVAYILGQREFWSLPIKVSPATLIPRPDTELLVETALSLNLPNDARVLDLGTGTGAIALALASEKEQWHISGVDYSEAAVQLATENAEALGLSQVQFFQSDWFTAVGGNEQYHLILSNPPYIDSADPHLEQGDVRFEPSSALVAENNGFADIEKIIADSKDFLMPGGWLAFEHGWQQGEGVRERLKTAGFTDVKTLKDLGGNERVTLGTQG
ncbi:MAG: peptide chain release factor N(5)-glutamine methyltransferase [Cellvibrionaceae bacterium]